MRTHLIRARSHLRQREYGPAIAHLRLALSAANRERRRQAAGHILVAIRCVHEARRAAA